MKLSLKLTIAFVLLMAIVTLVVATFAAHMEWRVFQKAHQEIAQSIVDRSGDSLSKAWEDHGESGPADAAHQITPASSRRVQVDWVWFDQRTADSRHLNTKSMSIGRMVTLVDDQRRIHSYVPLVKSGDHMGGLDVSDTMLSLDRRMQRIWWTSLGAIATMFFLSAIGMAIIGTRMVGRPLKRLVEKTQRAASGHFDQPLNMHGNDEISEVANALDVMCNQLRAQREQIESETEARIAALNQLRHADRLQTIGQLASGIAHELGTPLNVVQGHADLIQSEKLSSDEVKDSSQTIKDEVKRMTAIVRQLLNLARRKSGLQEPTDLTALLRDTTELLHTVAHQSSVNLLLETELESATVFADPEQLKQAFINVIMNGIHAMPEGGNIEIGLQESEDVSHRPADEPQPSSPGSFVVSIQDHGTGIAPENLKKIFEPFFTTKQSGEGTGLGLSIAYGIIQEHGGRMDVCSEPGKGTRFEIGLPKYHPKEDSQPNQSESGRPE